MLEKTKERVVNRVLQSFGGLDGIVGEVLNFIDQAQPQLIKVIQRQELTYLPIINERLGTSYTKLAYTLQHIGHPLRQEESVIVVTLEAYKIEKTEAGTQQRVSSPPLKRFTLESFFKNVIIKPIKQGLNDGNNPTE